MLMGDGRGGWSWGVVRASGLDGQPSQEECGVHTPHFCIWHMHESRLESSLSSLHGDRNQVSLGHSC